jgi:hypothetical protein
MTSRQREKKTHFRAWFDYADGRFRNSSDDTPREIVYARFFESRVPGPCECKHWASETFSSFVGKSLHEPADGINTPFGYYFENFPTLNAGSVSTFEQLLFTALQPHLAKLNWGKLPTSSDFNLIQIFAELDETLLMLGKNLDKSLRSYGSIQWGWLPLINDVVAIAKAVGNLLEPLENLSYEDEMTVPVKTQRNPPEGFVGFWPILEGEAKFRYTGKGSLPYRQHLFALLDRIGLHPDLGTAWDLVPLSFLLDYFVPIGDMLDDLKGGGWIKTIPFKGWRTVRFRGSFIYTYHEPLWPELTLESKVKYFSRDNGDWLLVNQPEFNFPYAEMPSLHQLINSLVVLVPKADKAIQRAKRRRRRRKNKNPISASGKKRF